MKPTPKRTCDFPGCERKHEAKGLCSSHYYQRRVGATLRPIKPDMRGATIQERLQAHSEEKSGCRIWTRFRNPSGYGTVRWGGRVWFAHRAAYTLAHGPIPDGMLINHICGNHACIKVDHLEMVTPRENSEYRTRLTKLNTTGYRGVSIFRSTGKFKAKVTSGGEHHYLGLFDTAEEASEAAQSARAKFHSMPEFSSRISTQSDK